MATILEDGLDALGGLLLDDKNNLTGLAKVGTTIGSAMGLFDSNTPLTGYQGSIPEYDLKRETVPNTYDPNRRAGSGGQRYFTDAQYMPKSETAAAPMSAEGLAALNASNPAQEIKNPVTTMAAKIPARIEGEQEARLSDGEFVIPADVVSHLGNGNSDAGAKVLKDMMSRIRKARTGNKKQGKEIDPKKFLPT